MANPIPFVLSPDERAKAETQRSDEDARVAAYWRSQSPGAAMSAAPPEASIASPVPNASFAPAPPPVDASFQGGLAPETAPPPTFGRKPEPPRDASGAPIDVASEFRPADVVTPGDTTRVAKATAGVAPTAAENQDFAAFKAQLGKSPSRGGGALGGAPANPDPYGAKAAQGKVLGSYDTQASATRALATGEADKAQMIAEHTEELARRKQEDAVISSAEEDVAAKKFDSDMTELRQQLDDVRTRKIDPYKQLRSEPGLAMNAIVSGILGGLYMGATHGQENTALRDLDRQIDRQMALETDQLDREGKSIGQSLSLLGQQRQIHRDNQVAKLATRNLYYEATKEQLLAQAAEQDSPLYQARADEAVSHITREQGGLEMKLAEAKRAQAMAAGAQALAQRKEILAAYRDTYDKVLASTGSPAAAENEAKRQIEVLYNPNPHTAGKRAEDPNAMTGIGKEGREKIAVERHEAQQELNALVNTIDSARKDIPAITSGGAFGNATSGLPAWVPGVTGARKDVNARETYNRSVMTAVGAGYKLSTGGVEPKNPRYIEEMAEPFHILPTDNAETAKRKMDDLERWLTQSAAAKGATNQRVATVQRYDEKGKPK